MQIIVITWGLTVYGWIFIVHINVCIWKKQSRVGYHSEFSVFIVDLRTYLVWISGHNCICCIMKVIFGFLFQFQSDDVEKIYHIFSSGTLDEQVKKSALEQLVLMLLGKYSLNWNTWIENFITTFQRIVKEIFFLVYSYSKYDILVKLQSVLYLTMVMVE